MESLPKYSQAENRKRIEVQLKRKQLERHNARSRLKLSVVVFYQEEFERLNNVANELINQQLEQLNKKIHDVRSGEDEEFR